MPCQQKQIKNISKEVPRKPENKNNAKEIIKAQLTPKRIIFVELLLEENLVQKNGARKFDAKIKALLMPICDSLCPIDCKYKPQKGNTNPKTKQFEK